MAYVTQVYMFAKFGEDNIKALIMPDEDGATIDLTVLQSAIDYAEADVNSNFINSQYTTPFNFNDNGSALIVQDWCANIAMHWIYSTRGNMDYNENNKYDKMKEDTVLDMAKFAGGQKGLNAEKVSSFSDAPCVV